MIRTKDLVLFVSILLVLFLAISATVADRIVESSPNTRSIFTKIEPTTSFEATAESTLRDRQSVIDRLRTLIAAGDVIEATPSVTGSEVEEVSAAAASDETVLTCPTPDTGIGIARQWPLDDVMVSTIEGTRLIEHVVYGPVVGSSTEPSVLSKRSLLQLPIRGVAGGETICLDTEIIGVTVDGSLMFNNDAVLYRHTGSEVLVGYARDGFPIYGAYTGARDACGGYQSATGYRYTASPSESVFLKCFTGAPRSFIP